MKGLAPMRISWTVAAGTIVWILLPVVFSITSPANNRYGALLAQSEYETVVLRGHLGAVTMAEFTPDGEKIVTASADETARLWSATDGKLMRVFSAHTGPVYCLSVSGDGRWLATGAQDNTVRFWSIPQTRPLQWNAAHEGAVRALHQSPDGQLVASVGADRRLRLEVALGEMTAQVYQRQGHAAEPTALAVRGDTMQVASGDAAGDLWLWSPYLDAPQFVLGGHAGSIVAIGYLGDNRWLSAGQDGFLKLWQPPLPLRRFDPLGAPVTALALLPNQRVALVATRDAKLSWLDLDQGQITRRVDLPGEPVAITVSGDSAYVAAGLVSGEVLLFRQSDGTLLQRHRLHESSVRQLVFHGDNQRYWSVGDDGRVQLSRVAVAPTALSGHSQPVTVVAGSVGEPLFVTAAQDQSVRLWNGQGQAVRAVAHPPASITAVAVRPDNALIATGDAQGGIRLWQAGDGQLLAQLSGSPEPVLGLAFSADGQSLASLSRGGEFRRWQVPTPPRQLSGHGAPVRDMALCQADLVLTGSADQTVRLWRPSDAQHLRQLDAQLGPVVAVALSWDGRCAAAIGENGALEAWRTADGVRLAHWNLAAGRAKDVAVDSNGERIVTLDADNLVRLWKVPTEPIQNPGDLPQPEMLPALPAAPSLISVGQASKTIYVATDSGTVYAWDASQQQWRPALGGLSGPITALAILEPVNRAAAASADGTIAVWNLDQTDQPRTPQIRLSHGAPVHTLAWQDQGQLLVSAGEGAVRLWNPADGALWEQFIELPQPVRAVGFAAGTVLIGAAENSVRLVKPTVVKRWSLPQAAELKAWALADPFVIWSDGKSPICYVYSWDGAAKGELRGESSAAVTLIAAHRQSALAALVNEQGSVEVWSLQDAKRIARKELGWRPTALAFSHDGQRLAFAGPNQQVAAYSAMDLDFQEALVITAPASVGHLVWDKNGEAILVAGPDPTPQLYRWNRLNGQRLFGQGPVFLANWGNNDTICVGGPEGKAYLVGAGSVTSPTSFAEVSVAVTAMAATSDGARVALALNDGTTRVYNASDRQVLAQWQTEAPARGVAFSPDNQRLLVALAGGVLQIHDAAQGNVLEYFRGHTATASARWLPDNRTVVSAGEDQSVRLWSLNVQRAVRAHAGGVRAMAWLTGGGQCVTVGADQKWRLWNSGDLQEVRAIDLPAQPTAVAVRPDNQRIAAGLADGTAALWNINNGELVAQWRFGGPVTGIAFSPDNQKLAIAAEDGLHLLAIPVPAQPGVEYQVEQHVVPESPVTTLAFLADNRTVRAGHAGGQLSLWSYASPQPVRQFNHGGSVFAVALNRDGSVLVSASADQTVRVWDTVTGQQRAQMSGHQGAVYGLTLTLDAALAVSSGSDRTLRLWDLLGGRQLKQLASVPETAYSLAVHPSANLVAAGGADRRVHLFDLLTGNEQRVLEGHSDFVQSVAFNPQGTRLLSYGYAGELIVWDVGSGQKLWQAKIGRVGNTARYAPDGTRVVLANGDGMARVVTLPESVR